MTQESRLGIDDSGESSRSAGNDHLGEAISTVGCSSKQTVGDVMSMTNENGVMERVILMGQKRERAGTILYIADADGRYGENLRNEHRMKEKRRWKA